MKILIKNGLVLDMINEPETKDILIENDKITKVEVNINEEVDKQIDASGKAVIPGLINCHNHAGMNIFRGYSDDLELHDWLEKAIWPVEDNLTAEEMHFSNLLACIEMIKSGTTTFNDMYFFTEEIIEIVKKTGMRCMCAKPIVLDGEEAQKRLEGAEELYLKYNGYADGRVKVNIAFHAPYTCPPDTVKKVVALSEKHNTILHVHLSETEKENIDIQNQYGMSPTEYLNDNGTFTRPCILAHCVHLSDSDLEIIKNAKAGIAYNPISNCKLASGIADTVKYRKAGVPVGIGTDGAGSTNTLDMFEEMKVGSYLQKQLHKKASVINAKTMLEMATIEGAKALGMDEEIGSIEVGKKADIILVDLSAPHMQPVNDIYSNIVYSANGHDVSTSIVNGKIIMEDRRLIGIDKENVIDRCGEIAKKYFK